MDFHFIIKIIDQGHPLNPVQLCINVDLVFVLNLKISLKSLDDF